MKHTPALLSSERYREEGAICRMKMRRVESERYYLHSCNPNRSGRKIEIGM